MLSGVRAIPPSLPVAAIPSRIVTEGSQKVDLAQIGPEGLDEVELAVSALPEHEVAEALLARGADDQVGIRLPLRVEVLGDELGGQDLGQVVDRAAALAVAAHDAAHGIRDLAPAAVADGQVDVQPGAAGG